MINIAKETRINARIRARELRVIGAEGEQLGILKTPEALKLAEQKDMDLVEVAPEAAPPVCRIMNYGKFKYSQRKREREARKKQKSAGLKEIKFRPTIEEHDYQVKLRSAQKFLEHHNKLKITMIFRGRQIAHFELGNRIIKRLIKDLEATGRVERGPYRERKILITIIVPN
ncbi:MAG: translation initiation factor IF-3 [Candidatus Omnitrophota bacterium]|nr:translation initiation factor IF-3 [Candidatus Omnitrophota bacterium]